MRRLSDGADSDSREKYLISTYLDGAGDIMLFYLIYRGPEETLCGKSETKFWVLCLFSFVKIIACHP